MKPQGRPQHWRHKQSDKPKRHVSPAAPSPTARRRWGQPSTHVNILKYRAPAHRHRTQHGLWPAMGDPFVSRQGKTKIADRGLAAAFVAGLLFARDQPVSLLQKSDRLAGGPQRAIIYTRPYRRQSPISGTFGIVARLD